MHAMDDQWDLLIVGASFAGAACALAARQYGLRVAVIERKRDPGLKLHTTGIIVCEAAEGTWLQQLPSALVRRIDAVQLYAPNLRSIHLRQPGYYFLTTDTPNVLRWLTEQMRGQGVDVQLGTAFQDAHRDGVGWRLQGIGHCRWLVGADGAKSRVAERCRLGRVSDFLYGVEHEYPGLALDRADALHCYVSRKLAPGYIGWAAQNPTGVQVGLARRYHGSGTEALDVNQFLDHAGEALGFDPGSAAHDVRAGLIPCGGLVANSSGRGVVLVGDAAGIVSPLTAGGIHSSWRHGWQVGEAIGRHVRDHGPDPAQVARQVAPRFRLKGLLRSGYDQLQMDWPFNLMLGTAPLRWAAERVYFNRGRQRARHPTLQNDVAG